MTDALNALFTQTFRYTNPDFKVQFRIPKHLKNAQNFRYKKRFLKLWYSEYSEYQSFRYDRCMTDDDSPNEAEDRHDNKLYPHC